MGLQEFVRLEAEIDRAWVTDLRHAEMLAERYVAMTATEPNSAEAARSPWFRARFLAARVLLDGGRPGRGLAQLEPIVPLAEDLPAKLACELRLLAAEALARLGRVGEARSHLNLAVRCAMPLRGDPRLRLRALRVRLWLGQVADLADDLAELAADLEGAGDRANLALLLCEEGRAREARGDLTSAEVCWRRAEGIADGGAVRADVLVQLGRLEQQRGHLQAALDAYEAAIAAVPPTDPKAAEAGLRRLLVLVQANQAGRAREGLDRLRAAWAPGGIPEELAGLVATLEALLEDEPGQVVDDETRAYVLAARGDHAAALALYREAAAVPGELPERSARLALAVGLLTLDGGDRAEAGRWLDRAVALADRHNLPEVRWRARRGLGRLAAAGGDEAQARWLFEEAAAEAEAQAARFRDPRDRGGYLEHHEGVLRQLLREASRRGDLEATFRYQELARGRYLLELWHDAGRRHARVGLPDASELDELDHRIAQLEDEIRDSRARQAEANGPKDRARASALVAECVRVRGELLCRRERRLDEILGDPRRRSDASLPALATLDALRRVLPSGAVYIAASLFEDEVALLVVRREACGRVVRVAGGVGTALEEFRRCVEGQLRGYPARGASRPEDRAELEARLDELGRGPLGWALAEALGGPGERLIWVPDGPLHGFPIAALRRGGRYLVEDHEVVVTFSGSLLVHQARRRRGPWRWGRAVVVAGSPGGTLRFAELEANGVAAAFRWPHRYWASGATRAAIRRRLPRARVLHLACHAEFDVGHPLEAGIELPSGERWRAVEWPDEPVDGLSLVVLGACRSGAVARAPAGGPSAWSLARWRAGCDPSWPATGVWPTARRSP
jgi:tetratricopeptide (TPR) repeat protein